MDSDNMTRSKQKQVKQYGNLITDRQVYADTGRKYNYLVYTQQEQSSHSSPYHRLELTPRQQTIRDIKQSPLQSTSSLQVPSHFQATSTLPGSLKVVPVKPENNLYTLRASENVDACRQQIGLQANRIPTKPDALRTQNNMDALKQVQRLKMVVDFLQRQVKQLKMDNQQITRQKQKINSNYIALINKDMLDSQRISQQSTTLKVKHSQQLNNYALEIRRLTQQNIELQQLHSFQVINQQKLRQKSMQLQQKNYQLERQIQSRERQTQSKGRQIQVKGRQLLNSLQKVKYYQDLIYKKEFELQETRTRQQLLQRQLNSKKAQTERLRTQKISIQQSSDLMQKRLQQLQSDINLLNENKRQMAQQIGVLLNMDHQKEFHIQQQNSTIETLSKQLLTLRQVNDEMIRKLQGTQSQLRLKDTTYRQEISGLQVLQRKLKQQNGMLVRQVESLKEREKTMIESQRANREKYSSSLQRKTKQVEDLIIENQRLYKEINKLKFNSTS